MSSETKTEHPTTNIDCCQNCPLWSRDDTDIGTCMDSTSPYYRTQMHEKTITNCEVQKYEDKKYILNIEEFNGHTSEFISYQIPMPTKEDAVALLKKRIMDKIESLNHSSEIQVIISYDIKDHNKITLKQKLTNGNLLKGTITEPPK